MAEHPHQPNLALKTGHGISHPGKLGEVKTLPSRFLAHTGLHTEEDGGGCAIPKFMIKDVIVDLLPAV
jgi:hypothetical protein